MKMTEVITRFRELNPGVQESAAKLAAELDKAVCLAKDADACGTEEGRKAIVSALVVAVMTAKLTYSDVVGRLSEMDEAIRSYTRKFETASGPKEDPNQPELPGLGTASGGTEAADNDGPRDGGTFERGE